MTRQDAGIEGPLAPRIAEALAKQDEIFRGTFPGALGARITEVAEGTARGELAVDERVLNPGGVAHGGAIAGFGDTVAAWASFPSLAEHETFTTVDLKASFIAAALPGEMLTGVARVLHRGRRTMVIDVRITVGERLIAVLAVTQAILRTDSSARY